MSGEKLISLSRLASFKDGDQLTFPNEPTILGPDDFVTDDIDKYRQKLLEVIDDEVEVDRMVTHEAAHMITAQSIGVEAVVCIGRDPATNKLRPYATSFGPGVVPKLGIAAIFAAPFDPSEKDVTKLQTMGYKSAEDVAERIIAWNRADNGLFIPVPQGYLIQSPSPETIEF